MTGLAALRGPKPLRPYAMSCHYIKEVNWRGLEPSICSPFGVPRYQTCDHQSTSKSPRPYLTAIVEKIVLKVRPHIGHCTQ